MAGSSTDRELAASMTVRKAEPLSQQVTRLLAAEIQAGAFRPGDRLPSEVELARGFGVSRTIMREALASLKNDDILEARQGKGITVKDPLGRQAFRFSDVFGAMIAEPEVNYLYEMRAILESEAAALAALRHDEEEGKAMEAALEALAEAVKKGRSGEDAHNFFNEALVCASRNPVLVEFLNFLRAKLSSLAKELRLNTMMSPERARLVLSEHSRIVAAVRSRDAGEARAAVVYHLRNAAARAGITIFENLS